MYPLFGLAAVVLIVGGLLAHSAGNSEPTVTVAAGGTPTNTIATETVAQPTPAPTVRENNSKLVPYPPFLTSAQRSRVSNLQNEDDERRAAPVSSSNRYGNLGLSAEDLISPLMEYVTGTTVSKTADGRPHRVVKLKGGDGVTAQMILVGDPADLEAATISVLFTAQEGQSHRAAAAAMIFLELVFPNSRSNAGWFGSSLDAVARDVKARPAKVIGNRRVRMVTIPTTDGAMVSLIASDQRTYDGD